MYNKDRTIDECCADSCIRRYRAGRLLADYVIHLKSKRGVGGEWAVTGIRGRVARLKRRDDQDDYARMQSFSPFLWAVDCACITCRL